MAHTDGNRFVCPQCGAANQAEAVACFLCGGKLEPPKPSAATGEPGAAPMSRIANVYAPPAASESAGRVFHLNSLLLIIALIAVCMGVIHEAPGLGIPLAVVSLIALNRTANLTVSATEKNRPTTLADKVVVFFATIGVAILLFLCVCVAIVSMLYAMCAILAPNGLGSSAAQNVGYILAGIAAFIGLYRISQRLARVRTIGGRRRDLT